jgi:hypothetical protein
MKRTHSYKLRQLPLCKWCFSELDKAHKDFCSPNCSEAATAWKNAAHWQKIGQDVNKNARTTNNNARH